jgi:hypothetical protein
LAFYFLSFNHGRRLVQIIAPGLGVAPSPTVLVPDAANRFKTLAAKIERLIVGLILHLWLPLGDPGKEKQTRITHSGGLQKPGQVTAILLNGIGQSRRLSH